MRKKETQITTIIGAGTECEGDFKSESVIRIDGVINGNIVEAKMVIVGASGVINGNISAQTVVIGGEIHGNLNVPEKVELTSTARVFGDITTGGLVVDEKAIFQGRCNMNQDADKKFEQSNKTQKTDRKNTSSTVTEAPEQVEKGTEANRG